MTKCYKCQAELTASNEADEHVILNACGGRLKSKELLCNECNSTFGESYDAELARQTNSLANRLLIKRHRGTPPAIKGVLDSNGKKCEMPYGGQPVISDPVVSKKVVSRNIEVSIEARDMGNLREILKGLKRKYPSIDIEEMEKAAKNKYLGTPIHIEINIGGDDAFRSITKSAINYFILKGGVRKYITHLLQYLEGNDELDIVWMHYPIKPIYTPTDGEISHVIRLVGNPNEKILYVYIELFNAHNYIVKLNDNYDGNAHDEAYVFDLINVKEIRKDIPLNYTREQLLNFFDKKSRPDDEVQKRFTRVIGIAQERQNSNHVSKIVTQVVNNTLGKQPDGVPITQEMIGELVAELVRKVQEDLL